VSGYVGFWFRIERHWGVGALPVPDFTSFGWQRVRLRSSSRSLGNDGRRRGMCGHDQQIRRGVGLRARPLAPGKPV